MITFSTFWKSLTTGIQGEVETRAPVCTVGGSGVYKPLLTFLESYLVTWINWKCPNHMTQAIPLRNLSPGDNYTSSERTLHTCMFTTSCRPSTVFKPYTHYHLIQETTQKEEISDVHRKIHSTSVGNSEDQKCPKQGRGPAQQLGCVVIQPWKGVSVAVLTYASEARTANGKREACQVHGPQKV